MNSFLLFISVFLLIYGSANYYIGLRGWEALGSYLPLPPAIYWLVMIVLAAGYPFARFTAKRIPRPLAHLLTVIGCYWMASLYYLFFLTLIADILRLLDQWLSFLPAGLKLHPAVPACLILAMTAMLIVYGRYNARHPVIRTYEISISKRAGTLKQLHIAMVSDIHIGEIVNGNQLVLLTKMINSLNPDIVLLPGDIIDENVDAIAEKNTVAILRKIKSRYGTFAVLGNHEYISGQPQTAVQYMKQAGITVLCNQTVNIDDSFYIIGRDDYSSSRFHSDTRIPLANIVSDLDRCRPMILLDHQPYHLEEAQQAGIDLQLSGHTHYGQFFPNQWITRRIFENDWGALHKGTFHAIVSCGFGTWGPPIRIGNTPEIVNILVHFSDEK